MKLTPLDIHHKEFRLALRGYNQEEVDQFLDEVADELERLFKENIDLSEKLEAANQKVQSYADIEKTLHNTMLAAQASADETKAKAGKEAEALLRDAELKAKELVQTALAEKQRTQAEFMAIKAAEDGFRMKFREVLDEYQRNLHAIPVSPDVSKLVGLEQPSPEADLVSAGFITEGPNAAPPAAPEAGAPAAPPAPPAGENTAPLDMGGAQGGSVQSLTLGETGSPDLGPEPPKFGEPREFPMPKYGAMGERDEDLDIEQID